MVSQDFWNTSLYCHSDMLIPVLFFSIKMTQFSRAAEFEGAIVALVSPLWMRPNRLITLVEVAQ
jgi:hypothetical protein